MSESLARQDSSPAKKIVAESDGDRLSARLGAAEWFVTTFRLSFPVHARNKEDWPAIEKMLVDKFKEGGNAASWDEACAIGRRQDFPPTVFDTIGDYNKAEWDRKQGEINAEAYGPRKQTEGTWAMTAEELAEVREKIRKFEEKHRPTASKPVVKMAADLLNEIAEMGEQGIPKELQVFGLEAAMKLRERQEDVHRDGP